MFISRHSRSSGVTLLDLLVVIAILIILAGVAIVAGTSARMRAYNTQALVCGEQIRKAQTLYYSENQTFADAFSKLNAQMVARCALVSVVEVTATPQGYTYTVAHQRGNTKYTVEDDRASSTTLAGGAENAAGASDTSGGGTVVGAPPTPTWPTTPIPAGQGRAQVSLVTEGGTNSLDMLRVAVGTSPAQVCTQTRLCTVTADLAPGSYPVRVTAAIYPPDTTVDPTTGVGTSPSGQPAPSLVTRVTGTVDGASVGPGMIGVNYSNALVEFTGTLTVTAGQASTASFTGDNGETGNGGIILTQADTTPQTHNVQPSLYQRGTGNTRPFMTRYTGFGYLPQNSVPMDVNAGVYWATILRNATSTYYSRAMAAGTYDYDCSWPIYDPALSSAANPGYACASRGVTVTRGTWRTITPQDLSAQGDYTLTVNFDTPQDVTRLRGLNLYISTYVGGSASNGGNISHGDSPSVTLTPTQMVIRFKGYPTLPAGTDVRIEVSGTSPSCGLGYSPRIPLSPTMTTTVQGTCT